MRYSLWLVAELILGVMIAAVPAYVGGMGDQTYMFGLALAAAVMAPLEIWRQRARLRQQRQNSDATFG